MGQMPSLDMSDMVVLKRLARAESSLEEEDNDEDDADSAVTVEVSNVTNGKFVNTNESGVTAQTTFTLEDVDNGYIKFIHDGSDSSPTFSVAAKDDESGAVFGTPVTASVTFTPVNDLPVVGSPSLILTEEEEVQVTAKILGVSDSDDNPEDEVVYNDQ